MHLATSSSWPRQNSPTNAARNKHTNTPERTILQNEYQGHRKDVPIIPITKGTPSFKSRLVTERGRAQTHPCTPPLACLKTRKKTNKQKICLFGEQSLVVYTVIFFSPVTEVSRCGKDTTPARHKSVHVTYESGKCFCDDLHLNANNTRYSSSSDPANCNRAPPKLRPANPSREKPFKGNRQSNYIFRPNEVDIRPSDQLARLLRILTSSINVGRRSVRSSGSGIAWQELFPHT